MCTDPAPAASGMMIMRQWRCEACDKLLGEFSFVVGAIKCPRCRLVNTKRDVPAREEVRNPSARGGRVVTIPRSRQGSPAVALASGQPRESQGQAFTRRER